MEMKLHNLPDETHREIFSYLDSTDLSNLSLVNDYFNLIAGIESRIYDSWFITKATTTNANTTNANTTNAKNKLFHDIKFHYDALCSVRIRGVTSTLTIDYRFVDYANVTSTLSLLPFAVSKMQNLSTLSLNFTHLKRSYEVKDAKSSVRSVVNVDLNQFILSNDNVEFLWMYFRSSDVLWPDNSPLEHLMDRYPNLRRLALVFIETGKCDKAMIRLVTELPLKALGVYIGNPDSPSGCSKSIYEEKSVLALTRVPY